jgi:DNA adenine methylase
LGVLIENRPATQVMLQHDSTTTLHFVDPPYVLSTRARADVKSRKHYKFEMTDFDHMNLLASLKNLKGMVVLSGYYSDLYESSLTGWQMHSTESRKSAQRGTVIATENVWLNEACQKALENR